MKSIVSYKERGKWGDNKYRGNATGKLIVDLNEVYKFSEISDYMAGSFTTKDVANELGIISNCYDLNRGFDLIENDIKERNEFIYWHPPYWDIIKYSGNVYGNRALKNDLSHIKNYDEFIKSINYCLAKQYATLDKGGRIAILMADIKKKKKLYSMLLDMNKLGTLEQIVIKEQINCMSDGIRYKNNNFIKIAHEYCLILRKDFPLTMNFSITKKGSMDLRDSVNITWKDLIASTLEELGGKAKLKDIYDFLEGYKKTNNNINWKAKIRQTLQINKLIFNSVDRGIWELV